MTDALPKKLKNDAIVEFTFEIRFNCDELQEIILGRLTDWSTWKGYKKEALPISNIPVAIRTQDPGLKYQPIIQLINPNGKDIVKIGGDVISYHLKGPYGSWEEHDGKLVDLGKVVFEKIDDIAIERLGLRYTNAITSDKHYLNSINDLNFECRIDGAKNFDDINVNYVLKHSDTEQSFCRIASPSFVVGGNLPENTVAVIDIDTSISGLPEKTGLDDLRKWIKDAHQKCKSAFFQLLRQTTIDKLNEE